jgi:hypothetical protein
MEWNLCHGVVKLPMNLGIDFYNLSQELAGAIFGALQDLVARGWLEETADNPGHFALTTEGARIRETAEQQTDAYFYAPWKALQLPTYQFPPYGTLTWTWNKPAIRWWPNR